MALSDLLLAVDEVSAVLAYGDEKHGVRAWDNDDLDDDNYIKHIEGMTRHLERLAKGETVDESGRRALAHVAARALLALEFDLRIVSPRPLCGARHELSGDGDVEDAVCDRPELHAGAMHRDSSMGLEWL